MIKEIRIFPPLGIARLGSSENPLDNFTLTLSDDPEGYRTITPQPTLHVQGESVESQTTPQEIVFRDPGPDENTHGPIRPVCPFFEVWVRLDGEDKFVPLTKDHLEAAGVDPETGVQWTVTVGNHKAFRRTGVEADKILASTQEFAGHEEQHLEGRCDNFVGGVAGYEFIPMGKVRYLRPTEEFKEIRLRFTPAPGKVYGPAGQGDDPNVEKAVYDTDPGRGTWHLHQDGAPGTPPFTNPGGIYAQKRNADGRLVDADGNVITTPVQDPVNLGYLDDTCDGIISVTLLGTDVPSASARVTVGPPDFAPDSLPLRSIAHELEQLILGAQVAGSVTVSEASDILRRALETVRLMNTVAMNGLSGLAGHFSRFDPVRENIWTRSTPEQTASFTDQRRVKRQHSRALEDTLEFEEVSFDVDDLIRESDSVAQLTDEVLQQMPAMMRGSDGMALSLTQRQRAQLEAGTNGLDPDPPAPTPGSVEAVNLTAQATRLPESPNPVSVYPDTAIANCFPGLESDFRNIWRRIFVGLVIHESTFLVVSVDDNAPAELQDLANAFLVSVEGRAVISQIGDSQGTNIPGAFTNFEWTNAFAHIANRPGEQIECEFVINTSTGQVQESRTVTVRNLFDRTEVDGALQESAFLTSDILGPGELTQGLCSPWQADFRECGCYYWAASRPDYVNTEQVDGLTHGHNWLLKNRTSATAKDAPQDYVHPYNEMVTYDELYQAWEQHLTFVIGGISEEQQ